MLFQYKNFGGGERFILTKQTRLKSCDFFNRIQKRRVLNSYNIFCLLVHLQVWFYLADADSEKGQINYGLQQYEKFTD